MPKRFIFFICTVIFLELLFSVKYVSAAQTALVRWVDDGDTIVLSNGQRVRYIGINAPELGREDRKPEFMGPEAKEFNKQLVYQTAVRVELDSERFDQYGRLLAYVFLPANTFVNREMLLSGYAFYLYRYPNITYHDELIQAQQAAMKARKGIWGNWQEKKGRYLGNVQSRRFHLTKCPYAKRISEKNRIFFSKMWDAFLKGFAPAKQCLPTVLSK